MKEWTESDSARARDRTNEALCAAGNVANTPTNNAAPSRDTWGYPVETMKASHRAARRAASLLRRPDNVGDTLSSSLLNTLCL